MAGQPGTTGATAYDFTVARFGAPVAVVERRVTVGTTVTQLLPNNPRRVFWTTTNQSGDAGAIGLNRDLTVGNGDFVPWRGGVEMTVEEDGEAVAWEWFAIGSVSGTWYVREVVTL